MASYRRYRDDEEVSPSSSSSSNESEPYANGHLPEQTINRYSPVSPPPSQASRGFTPISDASDEILDPVASSRHRTLRSESSSRSSSYSPQIRKLANKCNVAQLRQILAEFTFLGGLSRLRKSELVDRAVTCYDNGTTSQRKKLDNLLRDPTGRDKAVTSSTDAAREYKRSNHRRDDPGSDEEDDDDASEEESEGRRRGRDNNDSSYDPSDASHLSSASDEEKAKTPVPSTSRYTNGHPPPTDASRRPPIKLTLPKSFQRASDLLNQQQAAAAAPVARILPYRAPFHGNPSKVRQMSPVRAYNPNAFVVQQQTNNYFNMPSTSLKRTLETESSAAPSAPKRASFVLNPASSATPLSSPYAMQPGSYSISNDYMTARNDYPANMFSHSGPSTSRQPSTYSLPVTPAGYSPFSDSSVFFGQSEDRQLSELIRSFSNDSHPSPPAFDFPAPSRSDNFLQRSNGIPPPLQIRASFSATHSSPMERSRPSTVYRPPDSRPAPPAAPPGNSSIMANNPFAKVFANTSAQIERPESLAQESVKTTGDSRELRFAVNLHHYAHFNSRGSQVPKHEDVTGRIIRAPVFHSTLFDVSGPTSIRREASLTARGVYREIITTFYLNQAQTHPNDPNCVVLIRFCQESLSKPSYEIHPDNLKLMLNGKTLIEPVVVDFGNRMKKKKNPVYNQPIEVPLSQLVAQNVVLVRWTEDCGQTAGQPPGSGDETPKDYYLVIEYARRKTMEEILASVRQNRVPAHETVFKLYRALNGGDDDIVTDQQRVSLHCPASRSRITLPIRGRNCDHVECFDASSFLFMNKAPKARWVCPKCNKTVQFDEIVVDEFIARLLEVFVNSESIEATLENNDVVVREAKKPQKSENQGSKSSSASAGKSSTNGPSSSSSSSASTSKPPSNKPPPEIIVLD